MADLLETTALPRQDSPARRAGNLFISVTRDFPNSVTAQAVAIHESCRENGTDPAVLGEALLEQDSEVERIINAAVNAHTKSGSKHAPDPEFLREQAPGILRDCFSFAGSMDILTQAELQKLKRGYEERNLIRIHDRFDEEGYRDDAERMIQKAKKRAEKASAAPSSRPTHKPRGLARLLKR